MKSPEWSTQKDKKMDAITISGGGKSTTISGEQLDAIVAQAKQTPAGDQLPLPFPLDQAKLTAFLTHWIAIEEEEERLRDDKRQLKEQYIDAFPMRGILTAVKVTRARFKLAAHPKEPLSLLHQAILEHYVERHLTGMQAALDALMHDVEASAQRPAVPDMITGKDAV